MLTLLYVFGAAILLAILRYTPWRSIGTHQ